MLVRAATDGGGGAGSSSPLPHKTGNLMLLLLRVLGAGTPHNYGAVIYAESRRGCRLLLPWDAIIKLESVMLGRTMTRAQPGLGG